MWGVYGARKWAGLIRRAPPPRRRPPQCTAVVHRHSGATHQVNLHSRFVAPQPCMRAHEQRPQEAEEKGGRHSSGGLRRLRASGPSGREQRGAYTPSAVSPWARAGEGLAWGVRMNKVRVFLVSAIRKSGGVQM